MKSGIPAHTKRKPKMVGQEVLLRFFVRMRKVLFAAVLSTLVFTTQVAEAQVDIQWYDLARRPNVDFQEVVDAFERNLSNLSPSALEAERKHFNRWKQQTKAYTKSDGFLMTGSERLAAMRDLQSFKKALEGSWTELGPFTARNVYRGVGRINCMAFHPTDSNIMYAGSPNGGVWKTVNYGSTWENLTDHLPSFGVSAITIHPTNPEIIYVGSGDGETGRTPGTGVWRSIDGGSTWEAINSDMENLIVNEIAVFDTEPPTLVVAASIGIYKSADGGESWERTQGGDFMEMRVKPDNDRVLYAATTSRFLWSSNQGDSWETTNLPITPSDRMAIDVSPAAPNQVVVISENVVMRSADNGKSFEISYIENGFRNLGEQSWYNTAGAMSVTDPNVIYQGHVPFYVARGTTEDWARLREIHSDIHYINHSPLTGRLWVGSDGGVMSLGNDGVTWTDHTNMGISEIYKMSQHPKENDHLLNGYQDCGSKYFTGNRWISRVGADGMDCDYNPENPNQYFTTIQYGDIRRHLDGPDGATNNFPDPEEEGPWVSPILVDYHQPDILYTAQNAIWRYKGVYDDETSGDNWEKVSNGLPSSGPFVLIEQHQAQPNTFFTARGNFLYRTVNMNADMTEWERLENLQSGSDILAVGTPNDDEDRFFVSNSGKVFESTDGGSTFMDRSDGLPDLPIYSLAYDQVTGHLYAGCGVGVYCLLKGQTEWISFSNGLTLSASVRDIEIFYDSDDHERSMLKAATYGRGMWESPLYGAHPDPELPFYPFLMAEEQIFETETFMLEVVFRRGIAHQPVASLSVEDFVLKNAELVEIKGQGSVWTVTLKGLANGEIEVSIPEGRVGKKDDLNKTNSASEVLKLKYIKTGPTFGYEGPGGVGSLDQIALWLEGASLMESHEAGDEVREWNDKIAKERVAAQTDTFKGPSLYLGELFNGHPAVQFTAEDRTYLVVDSMIAGANISAITVAASDSVFFNDNAWMGSSRMDNGFIIHNNRNQNQVRMFIYDSTNQNLSSVTATVRDITKPHIYGFSYRNDVYLWNYTDDQAFFAPTQNPRIRFEKKDIDLRLGWDRGTRYGDGKMAEYIVLNDEIKSSHRTIIYNYLSTKYRLDIGTIDRFRFDSTHAYNLAGIGRESHIDLHDDARGTGILRINNPNNLEDGEYLLWASNGKDLQEWVAFGYEDFDVSEMNWQFHETGDVGRVSIHLPAEELDESYQYYANTGDAIVKMQTKDGLLSTTIDLVDGNPLRLLRTQRNDFGEPSIYPNPVVNGGTITIQYEAQSDGIITYEVYDMTGKHILRESHAILAGHLIHELSIGDMGVGRYVLKIRTAEGEFFEPLVVLNK